MNQALSHIAEINRGLKCSVTVGKIITHITSQGYRSDGWKTTTSTEFFNQITDTNAVYIVGIMNSLVAEKMIKEQPEQPIEGNLHWFAVYNNTLYQSYADVKLTWSSKLIDVNWINDFRSNIDKDLRPTTRRLFTDGNTPPLLPSGSIILYGKFSQ